MFDVILYQPEIPPNTGNIIRLCANTGVRLHLVKPLGFSMDDKQLVRAGLDYHEFATIRTYDDWAECAERFKNRRLFAVSTRGTRLYDQIDYTKDNVFLFGPETRAPPHSLNRFQRNASVSDAPRECSLNLSNAVAVVVYEAWRQIGFEQGPTFVHFDKGNCMASAFSHVFVALALASPSTSSLHLAGRSWAWPVQLFGSGCHRLFLRHSIR